MNKYIIWTALLGLSCHLSMISAAEELASDQNELTLFWNNQTHVATAHVDQGTQTNKQDLQATSVAERHSRLQIGGDYTYVTIRPHGLPSFKGSLGGAQASYEYRIIDSFYGGLTTAWKQGSTHGHDGKRHLLYIDVQERFGYTAGCMHNDLLFTFFTGLGYRHLGHKFIPNTGSVLYFRYNELYIPVGILSDYTVNSWFAIGLDFTWMPQAYPTVSIVPLKGNRWILTETLANFFAALPLDFTLTKSKQFHLILKPFYERWKDGHSTAETSTGIPLGLPGNAYNFWGVDLNFAYCF